LINLSDYYNASLRDSWHAATVDNNTLRNLPAGVRDMHGVKFDVRGIIQLGGRLLQEQGRIKYPQEVADIRIDRKATRVHFLHAAGWQSPMGTRIGSYAVHYANGETVEIPIVYGEDVKDWWDHDDEPAGTAHAVWNGRSTAYDGSVAISLYRTTWTNPQPEVSIESIDYRSAMSDSAPFLLAITTE
jgi:beta-galactosidase